MVKRHLYHCRHPLSTHPFEAFSQGSWQRVKYIRIRDGSITMHFENPEFEIEDQVPICNLRISSRKATLPDCTCFLRPGIDISILSSSTFPSKACSGHESLQPVWLDAKISSIERKPHESRCICKFYVTLYSTDKGNLSREIKEVGIDNVAILQQLGRKPCEDGYYRWSSSKDCPSVHEAKLQRCQFSSDVSWLLVASIWKGIGFDVRSVENKLVYQILDNQNMPSLDSDKNVKAVNLQMDNGVLRPNVRTYTSNVPAHAFVAITKLEPYHDIQENGFLSFYDVMDLRRSKRRNVQPERFVSYGNFSPCLVRIESDRIKRSKEEKSLSTISRQAGNAAVKHKHCSKLQIWDEKKVPVHRIEFGENFQAQIKVKSREVKSGVPNREAHRIQLSKNRKKVKATAACKIQVKVQCLVREVPMQNKKTVKSSVGNRAVLNPAIPSGIHVPVKSDLVSQQQNHIHINIPGTRVEKTAGNVSSKIGRRALRRKTISKRIPKKLQGRSNHSFSANRKRPCEEGRKRRTFLTADQCKQMIERCMQNIESEIEKEQPLVVAQWEAIQATKFSNQRWGCNWLSSVDDQVEISELDVLWEEMELSMTASHFLEESQGYSANFFNEIVEIPSKDTQSCQHEYKLDEEIGIICQLCGFVGTEIRDVSPPFLESAVWITDKELRDEELWWNQAEHENLDIFCSPASSKGMSISIGNDNVWTLIPDLGQKLHFHQKKAFEFLWRTIAGSLSPAEMKMKPASQRTGGCVISHSPGAGKTLLIISFLESYLKLFPGKRPLILAPKTTLYTWYKEIKKWEVSVPVYQIHVRRSYKKELTNQIVHKSLGDCKTNEDVLYAIDCLEKMRKWHEHPSILIMGYTSFLAFTNEDSKFEHRRYMGRLLRQSPGILILDEGHNPRSTKSRLRIALMKVKTELRILLSGTLFQNNFVEYYNTLCLARPSFSYEVLRILDPNVKRFMKGRKKTGIAIEMRARKFFTDQISKKINSRVPEVRKHGLNVLRNITKGFIDVYEGGSLDKLPGLQSYTLLMKSTMIQQETLSKLNLPNSFKRYTLEMELLITLGSIHPWLIKTAACVSKYFSVEELEELEKHKVDVRKGSKVRFVVSLVYKCIAKGEKVLIFCRHIAPMNLFVEIFEVIFGWRKGEEVLVLRGELELFERAMVMDKFEEPGGVSKVLLASITACAEGISLTAASRLVLLDSEWNPSKTKQAISRAFRPGQERVVYVYQLLASGSFEEEKYGRTTWKEWVSSMIFSEALVEDPSSRQVENIDDDVLREILEEDYTNSINKIIKHEKLSRSRGKAAALFSPK